MAEHVHMWRARNGSLHDSREEAEQAEIISEMVAVILGADQPWTRMGTHEIVGLLYAAGYRCTAPKAGP